MNNDQTSIETSEREALPWRGEVPATDPAPARWYCLSRIGMATLCLDEADAKRTAVCEDDLHPRNGPHRAVLMVEASQPATAPVVPAEPAAPMCGGRDYCGRFPFCGCGRPDDLPERDQTKTNQQQDLYRKFDVRRTDGSHRLGGRHYGCEYFVLDTNHDPHAKAALAAYASAVQSTHPDLASDLRQRYDLAAAPAAPVVQPAAQQPTDAQIKDIANGLNGVQPKLGQWERDRRLARAVLALSPADVADHSCASTAVVSHGSPNVRDKPAAQQGEAVEWQCRFIGDDWSKCSREHHEMVQAATSEWDGYETRALYTAPPARQAVALTQEQVFDLIPARGVRGPIDALWFARAIERAHGITPEGGKA